MKLIFFCCICFSTSSHHICSIHINKKTTIFVKIIPYYEYPRVKNISKTFGLECTQRCILIVEKDKTLKHSGIWKRKIDTFKIIAGLEKQDKTAILSRERSVMSNRKKAVCLSIPESLFSHLNVF
jgi:hypothetical protein